MVNWTAGPVRPEVISFHLCSLTPPKKNPPLQKHVIFCSRSSRSIQNLKKEQFAFFICFWQFLTVFPLFMPKSESLFTKERPLRIGSRWERFALFLSLTKNERFARRTEERIPNPAYDFCTIPCSVCALIGFAETRQLPEYLLPGIHTQDNAHLHILLHFSYIFINHLGMPILIKVN